MRRQHEAARGCQRGPVETQLQLFLTDSAVNVPSDWLLQVREHTPLEKTRSLALACMWFLKDVTQGHVMPFPSLFFCPKNKCKVWRYASVGRVLVLARTTSWVLPWALYKLSMVCMPVIPALRSFRSSKLLLATYQIQGQLGATHETLSGKTKQNGQRC